MTGVRGHAGAERQAHPAAQGEGERQGWQRSQNRHFGTRKSKAIIQQLREKVIDTGDEVHRTGIFEDMYM